MTPRIYHSTHQELAARLKAEGEMVDLLCVDAPYSAKTHAGHDALEENDGQDRRSLSYQSWTPENVAEFVRLWSPLTAGWIVSLTDDRLFPYWREALAHSGRTTFQDFPAIVTGMTVRLSGDGPSSWAIHLAVARPKALHRWGTLPGAYVVPSTKQPVVGGKPFELMRQIVRDYSRPGDLVCDPCCGAGTTLVAALAEGRRVIGGDADAAHAEMARRWCSGLSPAKAEGQEEMFGGTTP